MASFTIKKKLPYSKLKAEEEAKRKRDEEETARLLDEFSESFKGDDSGSRKFVRGGLINPNKSGDDQAAAATKKQQRYVPSFVPPPSSTPSNDKPDKKKEGSPPRKLAVLKSGEKKQRNIDFFLEELKRDQERRERREKEGESARKKSGFDDVYPDDPFGPSRDSMMEDGDPLTTNLYVGNLAPQVDENFLLRTFGRFGPIASVKIMWPRTEEEKRRNRMCGFVAFMNRDDAAMAKEEMQNILIYEYELRIGWGKAVNLPSSALPAPPPGQLAVRPKDFDIHGRASKILWSEPDGGANPTAMMASNSEVVVTPNIPDIRVVPPADSQLQRVIDTLAQYVLDDGCDLEQAVMERGRGNSLFSFLFELGTPEHTYYVWRLYSLAQGDTLQRWRTEPYIMITGSGRWIPPPIPMDSDQRPAMPDKKPALGRTYAAGRTKKAEPDRALTDSQRDEFEDMLRSLTVDRSSISDAMVFCLDNADAATEIAEVLTEALTLAETPIASKVARLMLVSDVLHNSSGPVKNASAFRTAFQAKLPEVMESFNELLRGIQGRITAEALKERVLKVLQVWSDWFLFSDAYISGLRGTFLRPSSHSALPLTEAAFQAAFSLLQGPAGQATEQQWAAVAAPFADLFDRDLLQELAALSLQELERRCRFNGLATAGGPAGMFFRLLSLERSRNSESLAARLETAKQKLASRGASLAARLEAPAKRSGGGGEAESILAKSKWGAETEEGDRAGLAGDLGDVFGDSPSREVVPEGRQEKSGAVDEQTRLKQRKLELAVLEQQEWLQAAGAKAFELDVKLAAFRKKLESQLEEGTWPPPPPTPTPTPTQGQGQGQSTAAGQAEREGMEGSKRKRSPGGGSPGREKREGRSGREKERRSERERKRDRSRERARDRSSRHDNRDTRDWRG